MIDPATLPDIVAPPSKRSGKKKNEEQEEDERKIDLSEIIGLPDFDVCPPPSFTWIRPSLDLSVNAGRLDRMREEIC